MSTPMNWHDGTWSTEPVASAEEQGALIVTAVEGSDAWRRTAYGFVHANAHALLSPLRAGEAMEVSFSAAFEQEFDQAGIYLHVSEEQWIKAGVEFADEHLGLGAVVTNAYSDWSVGYVDDWSHDTITVRLSRMEDAVIVRARTATSPWRLVRVAPLPANLEATAGPYLAAPTRSGFQVKFASWMRTSADASIH